MSTISAISNQKTIQQIIDESASSTASGRNTGDLGKTEFLNLLVTQLQYQDPLNPTDDKEFIGQMAQFSALEQMQNLNDSFSSNRAYSLIGKNITAVTTDETTGQSTEISGDVTSVKISSGVVYVVVDEQDINIADITEVSEGSASEQSSLAGYTALIGRNVTGLAYDATNGSMIKVSGLVSAIQKGIYEDYAILDGVKAQVTGIYNSTSTDPDYTRNQLQKALESGESIDIVIKDSSTGKSVPVSVVVKSFVVGDDGTITAVLNQMSVPVEGITKVINSDD